MPFEGYDLGLKCFAFDLEVIIDFNSWRMIRSVSGEYFGKCSLDCFPIAHEHPCVDVPF